MKYLFIALLVGFSAVAAAEDVVEDTVEKVEKQATETTEKVEEVVVKDKLWGVYGTYSHFDTWLPSKFGFTGSYGSGDRFYELAYQSAAYSFDVVIDDLGKISDSRLHLSTRSHTWGGSFNFQYGVYYSMFKVNLGNTYTDIAGVSVDYIDVRRLGAMWGMGNRWQWDNGVSFGVDYFKIFWPFLDMGGDDDYLDEAVGSEKDDVEELVDALGNLPTFSILHLELGYRF